MSTNSEDSVEHEEFLENRKYLIDLAKYNHSLFSKGLFGLSTGAFGITIVFSDKLGGVENTEKGWLLFSAWILFLLAVTAQVAASWMGWKDAVFELERQDKSYQSSGKFDYSENPFRERTKLMNLVSFAGFILGSFATCIYAWINLD